MKQEIKEFNCPDCKRNDTCDGCPRTLNRDNNTTIEFIPPDFPDSIIWPKNYAGVPNCCKNCPSHPINGGKGICNCIAPLFETGGPYKITSSTGKNAYFIG